MDFTAFGLWVSFRSDIPEYTPGNEELCFKEDNVHIWTRRQVTGELWVCNFTLVGEGDGTYKMLPLTNASDEAKKEGWHIRLMRLHSNELSISHHGFTTYFRLLEPQP